MPRKVWVIGGLILVFLLLILFMIPDHAPPRVTESAPPDTSQPAKDEIVKPAPGAPNAVPVNSPSLDVSPGIADKMISIDATSLLVEYQADEKAANARYENKKVAVTGVVSRFSRADPGFFGIADPALVTMGESHPITVDETLRIPGISAYSEGSSLFGEQNTPAIADQLSVGKTVTLVCTAREPMPVSETPSGILVSSEYRIILRDCTLQNNPESGNPSQNNVALINAAEQGDSDAQYKLGMMYYHGLGVPCDYAQAAYWYLKAAEQGKAVTQYKLGIMYVNGEGVAQDYTQAYFWMAIAASDKIEGVKQEDVGESRDNAASHLTFAELSQVQERVRKWREEHPTK